MIDIKPTRFYSHKQSGGTREGADIIPIRGTTFGQRASDNPGVVISSFFSGFIETSDIPSSLSQGFAGGVTVEIEESLARNQKLLKAMSDSMKEWLKVERLIQEIKNKMCGSGATKLKISLSREDTGDIKMEYAGSSTNPHDPEIQHDFILSSIGIFEEQDERIIKPDQLNSIRVLFFLYQRILIYNNTTGLKDSYFRNVISSFIERLEKSDIVDEANAEVKKVIGKYRNKKCTPKTILFISFYEEGNEVKVRIRAVIELLQQKTKKQILDKEWIFPVVSLLRPVLGR